LYIQNGQQQKVELALKELGDPTASEEIMFRIAVAKLLLKHKLSHLHAKKNSDMLRIMAPKDPTFTRAFKKIQKALHI
ncbi:hypothetical protein DXG01_008137, partial [Tephrocybe rancida]